MKTWLHLLLILSSLFPGAAFATALPSNHLNQEDDLKRPSKIGSNDFRAIIRGVIGHYLPEIRRHGAELEVKVFWADPTVNAFASKSSSPKRWLLRFYGGLARRKEMTPDTLTLVVCHEVGHLLGGYPFKSGSEIASEGQSDYFATQACLRKVWGGRTEENALHRLTVAPELRTRCDRAWQGQPARDLCYRISEAATGMSRCFSALNGDQRAPRLKNRDRSIMEFPWEKYPTTQCRFDTYLAGAVCKADFKDDVIPGIGIAMEPLLAEGDMMNHLLQQQAEAFQSSCSEEDRQGARPRCWFKQF